MLDTTGCTFNYGIRQGAQQQSGAHRCHHNAHAMSMVQNEASAVPRSVPLTSGPPLSRAVAASGSRGYQLTTSGGGGGGRTDARRRAAQQRRSSGGQAAAVVGLQVGSGRGVMQAVHGS